MPRNDEGDFELVLGNRQLLSGFFIVVILFGIFFTMGYIVGRHSSPAPLNTTAAASTDSASVRSPSPAAPPPNDETVRVLVGPLDSSIIGKMRMDLESAGFKPFPKKY